MAIEGYATFVVEGVRELLGYAWNDESHDDEVLAKLQSREKLSNSKHLANSFAKALSESLGEEIEPAYGGSYEEVAKVLYSDPDEEREYVWEDEPEIKCPYCGFEHSNSWDWEGGNIGVTGEYECEYCGKVFTVSRNVVFTYTSRKRKE